MPNILKACGNDTEKFRVSLTSSPQKWTKNYTSHGWWFLLWENDFMCFESKTVGLTYYQISYETWNIVMGIVFSLDELYFQQFSHLGVYKVSPTMYSLGVACYFLTNWIGQREKEKSASVSKQREQNSCSGSCSLLFMHSLQEKLLNLATELLCWQQWSEKLSKKKSKSWN